MTQPKGIAREFYDEMKARAVHAEAELAQLRVQYAKLVDQIVEIKRHELNMSPATFDPEKLDPMNQLGPKTQLAIDEYSSGDRELKNYLRQTAFIEWQKRSDQPPDERDKAVSDFIAAGDTG